MSFGDKVKRHLSNFKRNRLQVFEDGLFKRYKKKYPYILPKELMKLNIIEIYRREFWKYWTSQGNKDIHDGFHHLNSSQAMCFNLFFPLFHECKLRNDYRIVCKVFGMSVSDKLEWGFERVMFAEEGTNFDFYLKTKQKRIILR